MNLINFSLKIYVGVSKQSFVFQIVWNKINARRISTCFEANIIQIHTQILTARISNVTKLLEPKFNEQYGNAIICQTRTSRY